MRAFYYIVYQWLYKPVLKLYLKTDSHIRFRGFKMKVLKDVFHPKLFFSSTYFYDFLNEQPLQHKKFLEIGCGSGILSLLACRKDARVTAVDIDPKAIENTIFNLKANALTAAIIKSDVLGSLPAQQFDVIAINPPYYFKKVEVSSQYAWYCGENGEYFEKLFSALPAYVHAATCTYMILEENCEIERIKSMAARHNIYFELAHEKKIRWERNYIFKLVHSASSL